MSVRHFLAVAEMQHLIPATPTEAFVKMPPSHKWALAAIADDAADGTNLSYPGLEKIQRWSGTSKRRALELVADLIAAGLVESVSPGFPGKRAVYRVNLPDMTSDPVDNSQKMGATSRTPRKMGAEIPKIARDLAPLSVDPLRINKSSTDETTEPVDNSGIGDDQDSTQPRLTLPARLRRRRAARHLNVDTLNAQHGPSLLGRLPETDRPRILLQLAYAVLSHPAAKNESVTDPTRYVDAAFRNDPHVWEQRAWTLWEQP